MLAKVKQQKVLYQYLWRDLLQCSHALSYKPNMPLTTEVAHSHAAFNISALQSLYT